MIPPPDECPYDGDVDRLARELPHHEEPWAAILQEQMVNRFLGAMALCRVARGEDL